MGRRVRAITVAVLGLVIGLMANVVAAGAALSLLAEPEGARVRPMAEAAAVFCGAALGLLGGVLSLASVGQKGTRLAGLAGLILALSPLPLGLLLIRFVSGLRHLVFLP